MPPPGLLLRIVLTILLSLFLSERYVKSRRSGATSNSALAADTIRRVALTLSVFWIACWCAISVARLHFPFELEWIGGAMHDHCMRILHGDPLYVPPGGGWFPYEYPPVYFLVSGTLMRWMHDDTFVPMRLVSIFSTVGSAYVVFLWTRSLVMPYCVVDRPATRSIPGCWGFLAAGIFVATYRFTGAWYDAERLDMLFIFLSLCGGYLLHTGDTCSVKEGNAGRNSIYACFYTVAAACLLSVAFFTKQQAILFAIGGAGALFFRRAYIRLGAFVGTSVIIDWLAVRQLNVTSNNWFSYYCFKVPLANGIRIPLALQFVFADIPLYAAVILLGAVAIKASTSRQADMLASAPVNSIVCTRDAVFIGVFLMGLLGSMLSRAHWGGAENVLIAGYVVLAMAGCALAGRRICIDGCGAIWLYMLVICQFVAVAYRPDLQVPREKNRVAAERYRSLIQRLEHEGEVICLDHGGQTSVPHFQIMGLLDVMGTEKQVPDEIVQALRSHRYAVVVTDASPNATGLMKEVLKYYPNVESARLEDTWVVTGFPTPSPQRSVYILRP